MKKLLCMLCVLALTVGLFPAAQAAAPAMSAGGWFESLYAELPGVTDSQITAVSYSGAMNGALTGDDLEYLVRDVDGVARIDIPGLKAGTYSLTVTADGKDYTQSNIQVMAYDRSGYAHWNYNVGVGAYNNDGTLKANALVLYVTEENKEQVVFTSSKGTITGIGKILNNSSENNNIFKALFQTDKRPLVVRFIGTVTAPTGLTTQSYKQDSKGEWDGDNGYMASMKNGANVTLEGIGADATINGWGFDWGVNTSAYESDNNLGKNFEIRNLSFRNVPEDCASAGGANVEKAPVEHIWVHNCSFYVPKIPLLQSPQTSDKPYTWVKDKQEGDGACDFKHGKYMTMSYNYFEGYHKTSLLGGGDTQKQYHVTWHHNHWKDCQSRGPLCRQANMHIYNNLYDGQKSYCMSLRANCYIFSEFNTFLNCTNPVVDEGSGGVCKSYQDVFSGVKGTNDAKIVQNKTDPVSNNNPYSDFDTNSALSYIPTGDYQLDSLADAKTNIKAYAGTMKAAADIVTPGHTHAWGKWQTVKAATCTEAGEQQRTCGNPDCPVSGGIQTQTIEALGHNYLNGVCSRCGDKFAGKTYTLTGNDVFASMDSSPVPNMPMNTSGTNAGSYVASQETSGKGGTDNAFTLLYGAKSRLDPNEKTFADGFKATHRINFSGAAGAAGNAIRFTTQGNATVKVWWVGAVAADEITDTKKPRPMVILDGGGKEVGVSETVANNTSCNISTLELPGAGTYYLGGKGGKNFIYKVEVAVHGADPDPGPAPDTGLANGNLGANRELTWRIGDDGELNVTGAIAEHQQVLAAQYDTDGRFTGLAWITAQDRTAQVDVQAARIRLLWLENAKPLCEAVTAVEK